MRTSLRATVTAPRAPSELGDRPSRSRTLRMLSMTCGVFGFGPSSDATGATITISRPFAGVVVAPGSSWTSNAWPAGGWPWAAPRPAAPITATAPAILIKPRMMVPSPGRPGQGRHTFSLPPSLLERGQEGKDLVRREGIVAHPNPACVVDGVGHRRPRPADAQLANAFDLQGVTLVVLFGDEQGVEIGDVGVCRHVIADQVLVGEGAVAGIHRVLLGQGRADAPYHSADRLRAGGLVVEDAPGREHPQHPAQPRLAGDGRDRHLAEVRPVGVLRIGIVVGRHAELAQGID